MRWLVVVIVVAGCSGLPPQEALRQAEENSRRGRLDAVSYTHLTLPTKA